MRIFLLLLLMSCTYSEIYPKNVKQAESFCKKHGGWAMLDPTGNVTGRCVDGTYIPVATFKK